MALISLAQPLASRAQSEADRAADSLVRHDTRLFAHDLTDSFEVRDARDTLFWHRPFPLEGHVRFFPIDDAVTDFFGLQDQYSILRYNRADGLYLGVGSDLPLRPYVERRLRGWFTLGYGFGSHYWQTSAGLQRDFLSRSAPLRIGIEGHILTDTRDAWKMGPIENTLFSALAGIDARDYFQRRGFSASIQKFLDERFGIGFEYRNDSYRNARREVNWSLFGPSHPFDDVPPIAEGSLRSVVIALIDDHITEQGIEDFRWGFGAMAEIGIDQTKFAQYVFDARLKTPAVPRTAWIGARFRFASATGDAPPQRLFTLGGFGSLPGYPQNGMAGNRMLLLETDLMVAPFDRYPFDDLRILLENNIGTVASTSTDSSPLEGLPSDASAYKHSIGLYLASPDGRLRIGVARRTDISARTIFAMRLAAPF